MTPLAPQKQAFVRELLGRSDSSYQSQEMVHALRRRNCDVAYVELQANYGHDSFLVYVGEQAELVRGFLSSTFEKLS